MRCQRLGKCCTTADGGRCIHLEVTGKIGEENSTSCNRYNSRIDGMPIMIVSDAGRFMGRAVCNASCFPKDCCGGVKECPTTSR